jgi:hypothetical protein
LFQAQVQPCGKSRMRSRHPQIKSWQNFTREICVFCLIGNEANSVIVRFLSCEPAEPFATWDANGSRMQNRMPNSLQNAHNVN